MNLDDLKEEEQKEPTQEENIQSAIDEALNAPEDQIEDDTVDEETGELNAAKGEKPEQEKDEQTPKPKEGEQQQTADADSTSIEEDITGQNLIVKDGALVNPVTNKVVANAGRERRFYEQRELARKQIVESKEQLTALETKAQQAEEKAKLFEEAAKATYGVDPSEVKIGADIVAGFKSDPTGTLKKLLAEFLSKGYTIDGITTGLDAQIAQHLQQQNVSTQQTDPEQEAVAEVNDFYGRRPDARLHDGLIAQLVNANPNIKLDDAYYALRDSFVSKGLDWNTPLEQQIKQTPQQQEQQKPMPRGNGDVIEGNVKSVNTQVSSSANQSLDDIVRESMKEQGLG